jgi:hypothetical protein
MASASRYVRGMDQPKMKQIASYFTTTPYVDAYLRGEGTYGEFLDKLRDQAYSWGEQGLGTALVKGEQVPETDEGVYVLAIGSFADTKYAIVQKAGTDTVDLVEFDWPYDWDIT